MPTTYQLLITLQDVQPAVWRRIQIDSTLKLSDLHKVLQTSMGWTNSHLHQFIKDEKQYTERTPDIEYWEEGVDVDYKRICLCDLLVYEGDSMVYNYDFGDDWMHTIVLEKIETFSSIDVKPTCLEGARHCPPEDVGGAGGYEEMQKVLNNPRHPEYEQYVSWLGKPFQPEAFDATKTTNQLRKRNFGMMTWEDAIRENPFGGSDETYERFEGYTATEMNVLVMSPYTDLGPIKLKPLQPDVLASIPILNLSKFLLETIHAAGELKLTPKGSLPEKLVLAMYQTGFIPSRFIEIRLKRIKKIREDDDKSFTFTRALLENAGLIKKRSNKLSLTKTGTKLLSDDAQLFVHLLTTCSTKFDWSNLDLYENNSIGCYGFAFVLKLLSVYGSDKQLLRFYAKKYFQAFPWLIARETRFSFEDEFGYSCSCFNHRAIEVLLDYFGFVTVERIPDAKFGEDQNVMRTEVFDRVFEVR